MLTDRLARALRRQRALAHLTQEQVADAAGINVRHYRKLEAAEVNVTLQTLEQLGTAFGVDPAQLLAR